MNTAFAIFEDTIAETLGSARELLVLTPSSRELVNIPENLFELLKKHKINTLICGKLGNCMAEMLEQNHIKVIPGVSGKLDEVITLFRKNQLQAGKNFTCTENGMICGDCRGNF